MVASRRSKPSPSAPLPKIAASGDKHLPGPEQQTSWEYEGVPQKPRAGVDDPEASTEDIIAKLVSESDTVDRMERVVLDYFTASMAELVFLAAQRLTGGLAAPLNHKVAKDLTTQILAELVENERHWSTEIRTARKKADKEARARERARQRAEEERIADRRAGGW